MSGRWAKPFWVNAAVTAVLFALTSSGALELALAAALAVVVIWSFRRSRRGGGMTLYPRPTWVPWLLAAMLGVSLLDLVVRIADHLHPLDVAFAASLVSLTVLLFLLDREHRAIHSRGHAPV